MAFMSRESDAAPKHGAAGTHTPRFKAPRFKSEGGEDDGPVRDGAPDAGRRALVAAGIVAGVVALIYLGGVAFFWSHFMPGTTIAGRDVSLRPVSEVSEELQGDVDAFSTRVTGDGIDVTIKGSDVGLAMDAHAFVSGAKGAENPWAWPYEAFVGHDFDDESLGATVDEARVAELLADPIAKVNAEGTDPTDAHVAYDPEAGAFSVVPETYGTSIDEEACCAYVSEAMRALDAEVALDETCLKQPARKSDDETLAKGAESANALLVGDIQLTFNGTAATTVTNEALAGWVKVADDGSAALDEAAVTKWAQGELSQQLDTVGTTRTYTRPDGAQITVSGGNYGWSIDGAALAKALCQQVASGSNAAMEIPALQSAGAWTQKGGQDWPNTYIDLSIGEQYVRFYRDGELVWESPCVTGDVATAHYTPTGVYAVNSYKGVDQTLIGFDEDGDGEPDYKSHVNYWIPFIDNSIAFHDADWRGTFGGSIYTYDGSHGCVNLPYDKAQSLYDLADVGTVVVVHD